jgi:DNA polymerase III epsilon subunit family exonuclease
VTVNTPLFEDRVAPRADRDSAFPVTVLGFESDDAEVAWLIEDMKRDRARHGGYAWGDVALLYRTHGIGDRLEAALLNAGIPCRLAHGRSLSEEPVVAYVIAALRVIAHPHDDVMRDAFFAAVLPTTVFNDARAKAEQAGHSLLRRLGHMAERLPRADETGQHVRRALYHWRNLDALGRRHTTLAGLVHELLSRRVGATRSALDERHDEISDPAALPDVVRLAERLREAREKHLTVWMPRMGGVDVALKGILSALGFTVRLGGAAPADALRVTPDDAPSVGLALGVFKAAQLLEMAHGSAAFTSFTAIDLETTDRDAETAEIVEIAAVRVRDGEIVDRLHSYVKPRAAMCAGAMLTHGIRESDLAMAPRFEDVWPRARRFCGDDVVVAHNGYDFDFRILKRMVLSLGKRYDLCTYDTLPLARDLFPTSRKLGDLARQFGVPMARAHRALDDTEALAKVVLALDAAKLARSRKTALVTLLDHLGVALALCDDASLCAEARLFRDVSRVFALGRHSTCLDAYEREQGDDASIPTVDEVIERLGGVELMLRVRAEKSADERYPVAMRRLSRLIDDVPDGPLHQQLATFLERAVLSRFAGHEPERGRVNLLTLHSTKGLEFSRVYVVGVEDAALPGISPTSPPKPREVEEARRLLYVGMTRTVDRLVLTHAATRGGRSTGGHQFLDEMGLAATATR